MANKTFNTRICMKNDTYAQWVEKDPVLLKGEIAVVVIPADTGAVQGEPVTLFKVGDGTKKFSQLDFIGAKAADVYSWAKASTKPEYQASEIKGLADYISGEIQDTDTQYKIEADAENGRKFYLYSKSLNGDWGTDPVSTIEIPETVYTLATGETNGTVKFNGAEVAVKGLGSAAYTDADAYDTAGAADAALVSANTYADGKDTAIKAAKDAADAAQADVDALEAKVGTVAEGKTVVKMIEEAQAAATYDDTALSGRVTANETAITKLNGSSTTEGSVAYQIAQIVAGADEKYDTLKEISDWIGTHTDSAATMNSQITANKEAIAKLNGAETAEGSVAKTVKDAVDAAQAALQTNIDGKVDKVTGKGLSTNDYTNDDKTKLDGIAAGAQVNVIESVKVNGVALDIDGKAVDVAVPTGALADKDKVAKTDLADALKTEIEGKVNSADCGDIISHNVAEFATAGHNHDDVYSKLDHNHKIEDLEQDAYIILDCGTASTVIG